MDRLYKYIIGKVKSGEFSKNVSVDIIELLKTELKNQVDFAITGIAIKTAQITTALDYWRIIRAGRDCIIDIPASRKEDADRYMDYTDLLKKSANYKKSAYLKEIDKFDYKYFNITPEGAKSMDPHHRIFLQTALEAIEDAGQIRKTKNSRTGLYIGFAANNLYQRMSAKVGNVITPDIAINNLAAVIPGRISYFFNLGGPAMVIDTACSSSLVALHLACKAIQGGECDQAVVGGIRIHMLPRPNNPIPGLESEDGFTRAFDDNARGTNFSEGVAAVFLKPLAKAIEDNDNIYAVIKGSAVNQDGRSAGITAPSARAQEEVLISAWQDAGIDPKTITYIEAHGTGTRLGDPIEIEGMTRAFRRYTQKKCFCAIGSVKSNVGHTEEAAGLLSLVKVALALKHREIPPSIHFHTPNKKIDWANTPVHVNTKLSKWERKDKDTPLRCGVSSFGISGTNCHVVLEEAPVVRTKTIITDRLKYSKPNILVLSAKTNLSLTHTAKNYYDYIMDKENQDIPFVDICYTTQTGREHHIHRLAIVACDKTDLREKLVALFRIDFTFKSIDKLRDVYYQEHNITPIIGEKEEKRTKNELTEKEINVLSQKANEMLKTLRDAKSVEFKTQNGASKLRVIFTKIALTYVRGANPDWNLLYVKEKSQKVSLPTYPFERTRCWIDIPDVSLRDTFYRTVWQPALLPEAASVRPAIPGTTLLFSNQKKSSIVASIIKNNSLQEVIEVTIGRKYQKQNNKQYIITSSQKDYDQLVKDTKNRNISQIIHALTIDDHEKGKPPSEIKSVNELEQSQSRGLYSLFHLIKALQKQEIRNQNNNNNIDIVLLSSRADKITEKENMIHPENACLFGLGKAIHYENSHLKCRTIDIDEKTSIDQIINEINVGYSSYKVAYRNNQRYTEVLDKLDITQIKDKKIEIKKDNVYVITGGTGGIGLEIAKYLAAKNKVKLALINRSELPPKKEWNKIVSSFAMPVGGQEFRVSSLKKKNNINKKLVDQIKAIQKIEQAGSGVMTYSADVSDERQITRTVNDIRKKYKKINGIIHAAGIAGGGFIIKKDENIFRNVLAPKVQGTWLLHHLTQKDKLDFFINMSSAMTIVSGRGIGAYTAANSYLNSFAKKHKILSINWPNWQGTGLAKNSKIDESKQLFKVITPNEAIRGLDYALNMNIWNNIIIGELNYQSQIFTLGSFLPFNVSANIQKTIAEYQDQRTKEDEAQTQIAIPVKPIILKGKKKDKDYTDTEKKIARIWQEVLGYDKININDNFFEIGGDSLNVTQVFARIKNSLNIELPLKEIFTNPTLKKLAVTIDELLIDKNIKILK